MNDIELEKRRDVSAMLVSFYERMKLLDSDPEGDGKKVAQVGMAANDLIRYFEDCKDDKLVLKLLFSLCLDLQDRYRKATTIDHRLPQNVEFVRYVSEKKDNGYIYCSVKILVDKLCVAQHDRWDNTGDHEYITDSVIALELLKEMFGYGVTAAHKELEKFLK